MSPLAQLPAALRDKLVQSRFLTVSATIHLILLAILGTTIYYKIEPPPEKGNFQASEWKMDEPPRISLPPKEPTVKTPTPPNPVAAYEAPRIPIIVGAGDPAPFAPHVSVPTPPSPVPVPPSVNSHNEVSFTGEISKADWTRIQETAKSWKTSKPGATPTYEFTAFLGQYQGGNWNSTVRLTNGQITAGSLPNLLYCTSKWTKDRIKTNERNVKALALDSDELLATKPPFIFLTGTRDFKLTEKEVENLRNYIRSGGAVWGDSSVPGRRSAFDVAFRREMQRVMGQGEKFEALPANHPIFAQGLFRKVRALPAGINQYQDPVEVLRYGGEIAVIHTNNDYGDMWQIGLDKDGKIDLSRNARGEFVAMNETLWDQRGIYVRNIEQPAVEEAYKFGINMIYHLLTRWDEHTSSAGTL